MKIVLFIPPSKFSKNVARDLVYGCWCKGKRIAGVQFPPLSLISVGTVLKNDGFEVKLLDAAAEGLALEEVITRIKGFDALVMLTSTMTLNEDAQILNALKKAQPDLLTIVFGGHVTAEPKTTLERPGIDIAVKMEGENVIRDLARAWRDEQDWRAVKGIAYKEDNEYHENENYPLIDNLDELPIPDRSLLPLDTHYYNPIVKRLPYTTMFTTRGCPGLCTFCASPTFYGRRIRSMSAERVIAEIREVARLGYKEIFFRDEIFTVFKERVMKICRTIIDEKIDITWIASARINSVDREMLGLMKKAGCHMIRLGVESGVQELLNNVKKGITTGQTEQVFAWAHEVGMDTHAHLMIGLPGETKETIEETILFVQKIDPTVVTFGIMTPYPGTPFFNELREHHPELGDGTCMDLSKLHTHAYYNETFTALSAEELQKYIRKVYKKFYLRPGYIFKWLKRVRSLDELKRLTLAGTNVFGFIWGKD
ncbi:B12-binding domain-containing radical SAM protein [Candidatus Falkowbacteria bacterium CG23_combo_of_CG06-09_8_20_14_all_49_15]|uniref:B12-binding domain-containing radical SAM protein n=1 Tax=Candidatus Falkowbacteria bacterium CG23_combo_of_CG06-09_8_20_14_all_49_15 TaxID=1974572 RepID=A0A2G9ZNA8_9BACT|nr:MAG: B12-binding domain-containing radical SAM protein [Candidatus Falkowbacteria bacterium CG23_combo_of_CG06-09_8_20_14_all_49_15]